MEEIGLRRRQVAGPGGEEREQRPQGEQIQNARTAVPRAGDQVREVAQGMFTSMCTGLEENVITEENLDNAMENLTDAYLSPTQSLLQMQDYARSLQNIKSYMKKMLQETIKSSSNKEVTFDSFIDAAVRYSEGNISLFDLLDSRTDAAAEEGMPTEANLESLLSHPLHTLKLVKRDALRTVERRGVKWLWSTFTTKQLYWLLAVYFLPMMTLQVVVSSVSTAIFNGAIVFMALVTMQIAINSERLHSRMEYISVFQCFNRGRAQIRPPIPKRDAVHYLTFTVGLVVAIVSLGLSNHSFIYYEVLVIVCVVVSGLVMMEFDLYESSLFWFFMAAKAPSWLVVGVEKFCSLFSLSSPALFSTLQSPLWTPVVLFGSVTLEISYLSIIQVSLHLALLTFKFNDFGWKKFLSELGPLLLFLCWLVLSRYFVVRSSALHLAVMSAGLLLLPLTTCVFIASPLLFLYWYWFTAPFYYSVAAVAISAAVSGVIAVSFKYRRSWWMNLPIEYIILGSLLLLLGVVLFLSAWYGSVFQVTTPLPPVSAREYREYCGQQNWARGNAVQTQINCIHLQGRVLTASGEVQTVGISEVVDTRANSLKLFPYFLQRAITCHLGRYSPMCGNRDDMSTCVYNGCHFQHSLAYTFEIKLTINVDGSKGMPATLLVSGHHKEFVMNLTSGMTLHFNATFVSGMGSERVVLRAVFLDAAGLDDTQSLLEEREEGIRMGMLSTLVQSVKNSVAILFEVFLGYIVQDQ